MHRRVIKPGFDLLDLHRLNPLSYPFFLESASHGPQGRWDILFAQPGESLLLRQQDEFDFLAELDRAWAASGKPPGVAELPFSGGWFVYLGYELAAQIEPTLQLQHAEGRSLPIAAATRIPAAVIHDHQTGERTLVAEQPSQLEVMIKDIARIESRSAPQPFNVPELHEDEDGPYLQAVRRIREYIREGDVFQVNLSRQWQATWPEGCSAADLYRQLRRSNPGPFNGLACWDECAIICTSPERLIESRNMRLQTRPIAGTRPRREQNGSDQAVLDELLQHPKERAEHIMLIDLERNDLGRIAVPGSVRVNELMTLESYTTVHHIVSNVEAELRHGITPGGIIRAVFPGGTITGCPKIRCMEIIAELENQPRGAYTGSMGYLNHDGSMDLNILIRTVVREADMLSFRAGAGIVHDSDPERELEETRAKAAGLLRAMQGMSL